MKAQPAVERKMPVTDTIRRVDAAERMWEFFLNKEGQMVVDASAKADCSAKAVPASASTKVSETACSQSSKTSSNPVRNALAAEGAL